MSRADLSMRAEITWVSHPAREAPLRLVLVGAVMSGVALSILAVDGRFSLALASVAILTASISSFLFPTRFTLTTRAVTRRSIFGRRRLPWEALRRWEEDRNGILVSPYRRPGVLDDLRGIYLRGLGAAPVADVRALLLEKLGPAARAPGRSDSVHERRAGVPETPSREHG